MRKSVSYLGAFFFLFQGCLQTTTDRRAQMRTWPVTYTEESLDETIVINLDRDKKKMRAMQDQLDGLALPFTRFSAIYGMSFNYERTSTALQILDADKGYSYQCDPKLPFKPLSPGEVGNKLSHYEVSKMVIKSGHKVALVLEDDSELPPDFKNRLDDTLKHLPKNWDLIYLYCNANYHWGCPKDRTPKTRDQRYSFLSASCTAGNVAYLINAESARKINEKVMPLRNMPTDILIGEYFFTDPKFQAYCINPELVKTSTDPEKYGIDQMGRRDKNQASGCVAP